MFFSSIIGYVVLITFLLISGLMLWVFPDTSILEHGFASMEPFFNIAPWLLMFLIPAITMRTMADEYKSGTIEWLATKPISLSEIIIGKYLAVFTLVIIAIIPTLIYLISLYWLSVDGAPLDIGGIIGSYIGLFFLCAAFTAIGVFSSSLTDSQIVGFLIAIVLCFVLYSGFGALSKIKSFAGGADYYLEMIGIDYHYRNMSKGLIDFRDIVYFLSIVFLFFILTLFVNKKNINT